MHKRNNLHVYVVALTKYMLIVLTVEGEYITNKIRCERHLAKSLCADQSCILLVFGNICGSPQNTKSVQRLQEFRSTCNSKKCTKLDLEVRFQEYESYTYDENIKVWCSCNSPSDFINYLDNMSVRIISI